MDEKMFLELVLCNETQLQKIADCNQYTEKFGLQLSNQDVMTLMKDRVEVLREQQRVEFHGGILEKLIFAFCDSAYIYQDNYVETMGRLQEIFYLYKNESLDELSDDELIDYMREQFENECEGSLDHLEDTILEAFARGIRENTDCFMHKNKEDEDGL
jgi:hypothetical protein